MVHRSDADARAASDGVLAAVEEGVDKFFPFILIVRLERYEQMGVVFVLVISLVEAGGRQEGRGAQEGAPYHFLLHAAKLHIFL